MAPRIGSISEDSRRRQWRPRGAANRCPVNHLAPEVARRRPKRDMRHFRFDSRRLQTSLTLGFATASGELRLGKSADRRSLPRRSRAAMQALQPVSSGASSQDPAAPLRGDTLTRRLADRIREPTASRASLVTIAVVRCSPFGLRPRVSGSTPARPTRRSPAANRRARSWHTPPLPASSTSPAATTRVRGVGSPLPAARSGSGRGGPGGEDGVDVAPHAANARAEAGVQPLKPREIRRGIARDVRAQRRGIDELG